MGIGGRSAARRPETFPARCEHGQKREGCNSDPIPMQRSAHIKEAPVVAPGLLHVSPSTSQERYTLLRYRAISTLNTIEINNYQGLNGSRASRCSRLFICGGTGASGRPDDGSG